MSKVIKIKEFDEKEKAFSEDKIKTMTQEYCEELEDAHVLQLDDSDIGLSKDEISFLSKNKFRRKDLFKPITWKNRDEEIDNYKASNDGDKLSQIMKKYSQAITASLSKILMPYKLANKALLTEFFPSITKENKQAFNYDFLPNHNINGSRILRFYTNISMDKFYKFKMPANFKGIVDKFGGKKSLVFPSLKGNSLKEKIGIKMKKLARSAGFSIGSTSPYDNFMMKLHKFIKKPKQEIKEMLGDNHLSFAPLTSWAVFSDGYFLDNSCKENILEQVFIIPKQALLNPEKAPLGLLERVTEKIMVEPHFIDLTT
jgi:hypothetical protein